MTFEEAKKILKKEGFHMVLANKVIYQNGAIREFEKPEVCEAINVANANRWTVYLTPIEWDDREARLKKELEEHANAPVSGKEKAKKGNPALKEAASQFNDALLDEQAKQIDEQNKEITRLLSLVEKKENSISRLYYEKSVLEKENEDLKKGEIPARYFDKALVDEQTEKIKKLEHEKLDILEIASSSKQTIAEQGKKIKHLGKEITRLNKIIHNKNEELRLTKIREKNLAELGLKYVGENEKLKKKLADKIVDEIDAHALKSAESALAYKEKVIAEKDDVIADLGKELAATKKELEEKTKLVDIIRNASKEYCDYGVAANEFIKELASLYVLVNNNGPINDEMLERCKNYQTYGFPANCNRETKKEINDIASGKENEKLNTAKILDINAKCMRAARESINDVFESYAAKYAKSTLDELKDKAYESFNAKAHNLGLVGSKEGKGIPDQMIRVDIAEELSKVPDDVIDQFLLFGEIIIKEEK